VSDASTVALVAYVVLLMASVFGVAAALLTGLDVLRQRLRWKPEACSFCGTPTALVEKLIAGPRVAICDTCTNTYLEELAAPETGGLSDVAARVRCSFCGQAAAAVRVVPSGSGSHICEGCADICRDILAADAQKTSGEKRI
jgi:ribosomal protein S14